MTPIRLVAACPIAETSDGYACRRDGRVEATGEPGLGPSPDPRADAGSADGRSPTAAQGPGALQLRSGPDPDRDLQVGDHLCRRREGRAALSRLSDRRAGRRLRLSRSLMAAVERRAA